MEGGVGRISSWTLAGARAPHGEKRMSSFELMAPSSKDPSEVEESVSVVYVEDDERLARLTAQYLTSHQVEVCIVPRGDLAISEVLRVRPDVVLLDLMLPGESGLEVCRRLRERRRRPDHHGHGSNGRSRPGHGARRGGRRLREQAVLVARASCPHSRAGAARARADRAAYATDPGRADRGRCRSR